MKLAQEIVDAILIELRMRRIDIEDMVDDYVFTEIHASLVQIVQGRLRLSGLL